MLRKNFLKEKLASGKAVVGTWSVIPSAVTADIIAQAGVDFLVIDTEHGPAGFETAQNMVMACESRGVSPGVRVPGIYETEILKALDIGAHFLHVPNVASSADARAVVGFSKYPPAGHRGFSPFTRAGEYSAANAQELAKTANGNTLLTVHIESKEALDQIEDILSVKELDILFLGRYDISKSLGVAGQVDHPDVLSALKNAAQKINKAKKFAGTIVTNDDQLGRALDDGIKYITYSIDCDVLSASYRKIINSFKKAAG